MSSLIRGSESKMHRAYKKGSVEVLRRAPYLYDAHLFEFRCCDAILVRRSPKGMRVLGLEVQLSARHILENCRRDFGFCHAVLFVTPSDRLARSLILQLQKLTPTEQNKVSVAIFKNATLTPVKGTITKCAM